METLKPRILKGEFASCTFTIHLSSSLQIMQSSVSFPTHIKSKDHHIYGNFSLGGIFNYFSETNIILILET